MMEVDVSRQSRLGLFSAVWMFLLTSFLFLYTVAGLLFMVSDFQGAVMSPSPVRAHSSLPEFLLGHGKSDILLFALFLSPYHFSLFL